MIVYIWYVWILRTISSLTGPFDTSKKNIEEPPPLPHLIPYRAESGYIRVHVHVIYLGKARNNFGYSNILC